MNHEMISTDYLTFIVGFAITVFVVAFIAAAIVNRRGKDDE